MATTTTTKSIIVKELDLDDINPNAANMNTNLGGSKIAIIGSPGTGKSVLIKALLHAKSNIIPVGTVVSGSEDTNRFYSKMFPKVFIYDQFKPDIIEAIHKRQKLSLQYNKNPWSVLILDDCMDDVKMFNHPLVVGLFKNSRHWKLLSIFANQYVLDLKPVLRNCIDGVFIFRDAKETNREKIWKNFASIVPYALFCQLMDEITEDYTALYIKNQSTSNRWTDNVYYYKVKQPVGDDFKFGCNEYWKFSDERAKKMTEYI